MSTCRSLLHDSARSLRGCLMLACLVAELSLPAPTLASYSYDGLSQRVAATHDAAWLAHSPTTPTSNPSIDAARTDWALASSYGATSLMLRASV